MELVKINFYKKYEIKIEFEESLILDKAALYLDMEPIHITDHISSLSSGDKNDYYSNGDYWWPDPEKEDGLPYIRRDGETNPDNFDQHRLLLRKLRKMLVSLTAAYMISNDDKYVEKAILILKEFFLDQESKMNPHLLYAQAIPGHCSGRGIGIIDTLHLIGIPLAIEILKESSKMSQSIYNGLNQWFDTYLDWIVNHPYGQKEMNTKNNHSVCWHLQAAVFARFTKNQAVIDLCKKQFKEVLLPEQMALDGSFPSELSRTKPYGYSIFVLDNLLNLAYVLSSADDNLWQYQTDEGKSVKKGLEFLYPYLLDKNKWPHGSDVQHFEGWPVSIASLLFAAINLNKPEYIELWNKLEKDPQDQEIQRNISIKEPFLWISK